MNLYKTVKMTTHKKHHVADWLTIDLENAETERERGGGGERQTDRQTDRQRRGTAFGLRAL